jgi:hypothetical protein
MDRAQLWCQTAVLITTPTAQPFQPRPQAPQEVVGTLLFTAVPSISPCT